MTPGKDKHTLDMFPSIPQPVVKPGQMDYRLQVSNLVSRMLAQAKPLDRYEIAARIGQLQGREIGKGTLDSWAAMSRQDHNLPFAMAPILEAACDSTMLTDWLVTQRGGKALYGTESLQAELGKMQLLREEINTRIRTLRNTMEATR